MSWVSVLKNKPHHEGRVYTDSNKLERDLTFAEARENGEILVLDAINAMPHVEKKGDMVIIQPAWLKGFQPFKGLYGLSSWEKGDNILGFIFNFNLIHSKSMCIEVHYQREFLMNEYMDLKHGDSKRDEDDILSMRMCIMHKSVLEPDGIEFDDGEVVEISTGKRTAIPADDYASFIYLSSNEKEFNKLWNFNPSSREPNLKNKRVVDDIFFERQGKYGNIKKKGVADLNREERLKLRNLLGEQWWKKLATQFGVLVGSGDTI